jgi:hypothetical protein
MFDICVINQRDLNYDYVQTHIIILHQHVAVTPVTIIRFSYNNNKITIQLLVQKYTIKKFEVTVVFCIIPYAHKISIITLLKYS